MEGYRLNPLLSREQIDSIVKKLAEQISRDYREKELILVCILKGAFMFLSDLVRHLQIPVKICALLDKKVRREVEIEVDYLGREVDDVFVVGYGIDFNESYRSLPEIYYVTPADQTKR